MKSRLQGAALYMCTLSSPIQSVPYVGLESPHAEADAHSGLCGKRVSSLVGLV